eukprot:817472-Prorocentrum_minimum.AAC.1
MSPASRAFPPVNNSARPDEELRIENSRARARAPHVPMVGPLQIKQRLLQAVGHLPAPRLHQLARHLVGSRRGNILMTDQSDAGSVGIFS